jgi:hypothetical protein
MEPGVLTFITLVSGAALILLYFRVRDAWFANFPQMGEQITSSPAPVPPPVPIAAEAPSQAAEAAPVVAPALPSDEEAWTPEEILRQLALVKKLNKDGTSSYLSKERMAALVGVRAEEARAIIDSVRGVPPADGIKVRDHQGERVIAPLRTKARA